MKIWLGIISGIFLILSSSNGFGAQNDSDYTHCEGCSVYVRFASHMNTNDQQKCSEAAIQNMAAQLVDEVAMISSIQLGGKVGPLETGNMTSWITAEVGSFEPFASEHGITSKDVRGVVEGILTYRDWMDCVLYIDEDDVIGDGAPTSDYRWDSAFSNIGTIGF